MSAAAAGTVTDDDKKQFLAQDLQEFVNLCEKYFGEHKFECANARLTIGHTIINEFLKARLTATQPGQKTSASTEDNFTMLNVLAKTNAVSLTALKRAEYHEKRARTLTAKVSELDAKVNGFDTVKDNMKEM